MFASIPNGAYVVITIQGDTKFNAESLSTIRNVKRTSVEGYALIPSSIVKTLDLFKPQFEATARYGHFGYPEFRRE